MIPATLGKASRNQFNYQSVPQRKRFSTGTYSNFQLTRKLTSKQQIVLEMILYLLATRDLDQIQLAYQYIGDMTGISSRAIKSTVDLLIARGDINVYSLPRYSKEYSRALIYELPSTSRYYSAIQQTRASLRGMAAVSQRNFTQLMYIYINSPVLTTNCSILTPVTAVAVLNMTREALPIRKSLISDRTVGLKTRKEGNCRKKSLADQFKKEINDISIDNDNPLRYHSQPAFSKTITMNHSKAETMYTHEQKEFILSELNQGNHVDFYPPQIHKMFGLNDIAKIKLCAFPDDAIASAYARVKTMQRLKSPFHMLAKLCNEYCKEKGLDPDFKWSFRLMDASKINSAIEPVWDMYVDNEKQDRRPLSQPKQPHISEAQRWANMPKQDMDDLEQAVINTDYNRYNNNPGLKSSMKAMGDRILLNIAEARSKNLAPKDEIPLSGISEECVAFMHEKVRKGQMTQQELDRILHWRNRRLNRQTFMA